MFRRRRMKRLPPRFLLPTVAVVVTAMLALTPLGAWAQTINYEVVSAILARVPRETLA